VNRDIIRQAVNIASLSVVLIINALANALPINGRTTGEISDSLPTLVTPAGYVFAIWGLIYVTLIAFVIYQALPSQRENPTLRRIGYLFAVSNIANASWILLWHYELFTLTLAAMLVLLGSLLAIYRRINVNSRAGTRAQSTGERWLVYAPFSLYLGWISIATIANFSTTLIAINWDGFGISTWVWAAIILTVAAGLTASIVLSRSDVIYAGVIIWAFVGIIINQTETAVVTVSALGIVLIVATLIVRLTTNWLDAHAGNCSLTVRNQQRES
jgi:translocator protein